MSMPLQRCTSCGRRFFPSKLVCLCGSRTFSVEEVERGLVEETTTLRRVPGRTLDEPVRISAVRVDGVLVVARLESESTEVELSLERGAPVAR